jgi:mRNA degradation ribonuclease J1/J2
LSLLSRGENKFIKVTDHDTVILSSHAIPGNEGNVNKVIEGLLRAGCEVIHSGIQDVHATGHAQADELKMYFSVTRPQWFVPIHGEYRHMLANAKLAHVMGVARPRAAVRGRRRARAERRRPVGRGARAGRVPVRRRHRRRRRPGRAAATASSSPRRASS